MYLYGDGVDQNYEKAFELFKRAAEAGNVESMHNLGAMYDNGDGVPQDKAKALEWFAKAEAAGYTG